MLDWKSFLIVSLGIVTFRCGGQAQEPPCVSEAGDDAVLEAGALDAPEGGPLACWQCEPIGAVGAYNACTKTFLEPCASCDVFGPSCTPSACAVCAKDAAGE